MSEDLFFYFPSKTSTFNTTNITNRIKIFLIRYM